MINRILSIDQGTTSTRAILFDLAGTILATSQSEFPQIYPENGWVEHDPEQIWQTTLDSCRTVLELPGKPPCCIGITNQRETTIVWDRITGLPVYNAIVWQDRRTADACQQLVSLGHSDLIAAKTGLVIDAYFSASKIAWILENVEGVRKRAEEGTLAFGTVDSFLVWRLTGGKVHATDATNASRTMLFNIHTQQWDPELLTLFNIPVSLLPEVRDSADDYGASNKGIFGTSYPIGGVIGDQQGAMFGQACFSPGMAKNTCGTGCFLMMHTGDVAVKSSNRLLTTVACRLNGKVSYALEGSIFNAGTAIQWLRDSLNLIDDVSEIEPMIAATADNQDVYLVPAFTGLGAPHWDPDARGALVGITRDTGIAHLLRAALEAVCYQTRDLTDALISDSGNSLLRLRIDGGMAANSWLLQFMADMLECEVERPVVIETTALGAAFLAGLQHGLFTSTDDIAGAWKKSASFTPIMIESERQKLRSGWHMAIKKVKSY